MSGVHIDSSDASSDAELRFPWGARSRSWP
jgi:hypothetical protein